MRARDAWERIVSVDRTGLYESNYLKANSPDGQRGLWLKHNLLRSPLGKSKAEFWVVLFERGQAPVVAKREVPWEALALTPDRIGIDAGPIALTPARATGQLADLSWQIALSDGQEPLLHLPWDWMYTAGFPKKKALTPAPNLIFDGVVEGNGFRWPIDRWVGLRGHNWGTEHAWSYAYGNCNLWSDGAPRVIDGFSAKVKIGGRPTPWMSMLVGRAPEVQRNRMRHWPARCRVTADAWTVRWPGLSLAMQAQREEYVGLRYAHPDGTESYCYNTKFARVAYATGGLQHTSDCGELEVLFAEPLEGVPLHPTPDWDPAAGDYRSSP